MLDESLICHNETQCATLRELHVEVESLPQRALILRYELTGDLTKIRVPEPKPSIAADGLWKHTCFEVFIAEERETSYLEFNFSPSGQWAAYAFSDYRMARAWTVRQAPVIKVTQSPSDLLLEATIAMDDWPQNRAGKSFQLGLSAVIEALDGSRSYWALQHPEGPPDFHHRAGFILSLNEI